MKLTTRQILSQITEFWKSLSKKNKILIISLTASFIVIAAVISIFINNSGYVVLYSGLSSSETGDVISKLSEMGIDFKTQTGGAILVPQDKQAQLQMTLASEGYPQSNLSYDLFTSNSGFMTTDFEKKKYLLFQLQNRLQDAIKTIRGINGAIVTISLPEEDSFVLQQDKIAPTASVVLDLASNIQLSAQQVNGIEALVSTSVPGLERKNVAIVSNTGDMINNQNGDGSEGTAYTRLELEKNISTAVENKVSKLLSPIFGASNIRIAANTSVDINKKVSEQTTYKPAVENTGIIANQNSSKESVGGGSAATGGVPGTSANSGVTTYAQANGAGSSGSYNESSSTNYLNNQITEQIQRDGYEISDLTVSVLIGNKDLTTNDITQYKQMVAFAAGISTDKVVITNAVFAAADTSANANQPSGLLSEPMIIYIIIAAAVLVIAVIILVILMGRKKRKRKKEEVSEALIPSGLSNPKVKKQLLDEIVLNETREQNLKRQIKDFSSSSPDIVAQLIRTWIKEDDDNE